MDAWVAGAVLVPTAAPVGRIKRAAPPASQLGSGISRHPTSCCRSPGGPSDHGLPPAGADRTATATLRSPVDDPAKLARHRRTMRPLCARLEYARRRLGAPWQVLEGDYMLSWLFAGIEQVPALPDTLVFKGVSALRKCYFYEPRGRSDHLLSLRISPVPSRTPAWVRLPIPAVADRRTFALRLPLGAGYGARTRDIQLGRIRCPKPARINDLTGLRRHLSGRVSPAGL